MVAAAVASVIAAGAFLLPLALQQQSMGHASWISHAPIIGRLAITPLDFLVGFDLTSAALPVAGIVVAAALVGLMRLAASRLSGGPGPRLVATMLFATFLLPLGLALLGLDYLDPRNLIVALVPGLVLLSMGFATPGRPWLGSAAAVGLCLASLAVVVLTAWEPKYHSEDWRAAASDLGPPRVDRVVIATPGSFARKPLQFYLPGSERFRAGSNRWVRWMCSPCRGRAAAPRGPRCTSRCRAFASLAATSTAAFLSGATGRPAGSAYPSHSSSPW